MGEKNNEPFSDVTVEEVEAALASLRETPVPEGEDPFWWDQAATHFQKLLEALRDEVKAS